MYNGSMKILGIETSCDESAVCLIEAEGDFDATFRFEILGNALASQVALHAEYGGVFPNLAKREHAKALVPLLEQVLGNAGAASPRPPTLIPDLNILLAREPELLEQLVPFLETHGTPEIDAIAVTTGPGLEPALWVGINFARALGAAWSIPIVATNHMEGHIVLSAASESGLKSFEFPALALLISGGHTELVLMRAFGDYEIVGQTRDDAVGEAFDKVARLLGLPYPGGPEISRLAAISRTQNREASPLGFKLPRPMLREDNFDFSFSGLKTAVLRIVEAHQPLSEEMKLAIAREFEDAAADVIVGKTLRTTEHFGASTIIVGGGVSANTHIRAELQKRLTENNLAQLLIPPPSLATDNALMIALAGYFHAAKKEFADPDSLKATGNLQLGKK